MTSHFPISVCNSHTYTYLRESTSTGSFCIKHKRGRVYYSVTQVSICLTLDCGLIAMNVHRPKRATRPTPQYDHCSQAAPAVVTTPSSGVCALFSTSNSTGGPAPGVWFSPAPSSSTVAPSPRVGVQSTPSRSMIASSLGVRFQPTSPRSPPEYASRLPPQREYSNGRGLLRAWGS